MLSVLEFNDVDISSLINADTGKKERNLWLAGFTPVLTCQSEITSALLQYSLYLPYPLCYYFFLTCAVIVDPDV